MYSYKQQQTRTSIVIYYFPTIIFISANNKRFQDKTYHLLQQMNRREQICVS